MHGTHFHFRDGGCGTNKRIIAVAFEGHHYLKITNRVSYKMDCGSAVHESGSSKVSPDSMDPSMMYRPFSITPTQLSLNRVPQILLPPRPHADLGAVLLMPVLG